MMYRRSKLFLFLTLVLFLVGCDDPCDEGYTQRTNPDGSTYCLPDYVEGVEENLELGDTYYHPIHGVIVFSEGEWKNGHQERVDPSF